ncbi:MAG: ion transporter [Pseudomonadota bacterium]
MGRDETDSGPPPGPRARLLEFVKSGGFQNAVLTLILLNAVILGLETWPPAARHIKSQLMWLDHAILAAFAVEIGLRVAAEGWRFFRGGWNLFDFSVVLVSALSITSGLAALRALRVLRLLRIISIFPRMRVVVSALINAIPGILSVGVVVLLVVYVFAVIAANLYGPMHGEYFGDIFSAMYTLFQIMTMEGWVDIAAEVRETHPNSWLFFVSFLLVGTFTMLNLFVAIVVRVVEEDSEELEEEIQKEHAATMAAIAALRADVASLRDELREHR